MSEVSTLDQLIVEFRQQKEEFQRKAQALMLEVMKDFFNKNPGITAMKWTQYTPYFADGDPCVFNVNEPTFTNAPLDNLDEVSPYGEYEGEEEGVWATDCSIRNILEGKASWCADIKDSVEASGPYDLDSVDAIRQAISSSDMEDVMYTMFGDHVEVTATREGFEVNEYDHD